MGARSLLVTDIDGTLLGDEGALSRFAAWHAEHRPDVVLAYATGRTLEGVRDLVAETDAPSPDVAILQVGTEITDLGGRPWPGWLDRFDGWDAADARRALAGLPGLEPQRDEFQTRLKASFVARDPVEASLPRIRHRLAAAGVTATIVVSSGRLVDVIAPGAGKGPAARFVAERLGFAPSEVLAFGDTANDLDLYRQGFRGTVVANALPELAEAGVDAYRSPFPHAAGILDGIRHWSAAA